MDNRKQLMQTGVFKTQGDMISYLLCQEIGRNEGPIGSWTLKERLDAKGVEVGTATVGRYLKELDTKEYTTQKSNMGRLLTPSGSAWLAMMEDRLARARVRNEAANAMTVNKYEELVDLFYARRAIEVEAIRLACSAATDKEIDGLRSTISCHYQYIRENRDPADPALEFHQSVAQMSRNRFITAMLSMLVFEEKRIEASMETLKTRERGKDYVVEHDHIAAALKKRDAPLATELMRKHIDAIISAVQEQIAEMHETSR